MNVEMSPAPSKTKVDDHQDHELEKLETPKINSVSSISLNTVPDEENLQNTVGLDMKKTMISNHNNIYK